MTGFALGFDPTRVTTEQEFTLGIEVTDHDGDVFRYVQGDSNGVQANDVVIISEAGVVDRCDTTASAPGTGQGLPVGVSETAIAANSYGWVKRKGTVTSINVATGCAAHTQLNATAAAGRVDDDATAGAEVIDGLTTTAAESGNLAAGILLYPKVGRTL